MEIWGCSHIGRVRETNEDSYWIWCEQDRGFLVVADGMGGHQAGEVASGMVIQTLWEHLEGVLREFPLLSTKEWLNLLLEGIEKCNYKVYQAALAEAGYAGMGTTVTAALVIRDQLLLAHVGDSRLYLYRQGRLQLLTRDHSLVQELVDEGLVNPEEAQFHPRRHILTRAVGTDECVEVDTLIISLEPQDLLLLCTDGLTNSVTAAEIEETLGRLGSLAARGQALLDLANARGGEDNVTVILARVEPFSRSDVKE